MELGRYGVFGHAATLTIERARILESLGYGTVWEGGSPPAGLLHVERLLDATSTLKVATGIVNVWTYDPATLAAEYAELDAAFPERLLVGIGIGHREATGEYTKPLATMSAFLDGLDAAGAPLPRDRRCVAALGPRMLELCATRAWGTHTYFVPVAHTRFAREQVGERGLVAAELACVVDTDTDRARVTAREYAKVYLGLSNYTSNLLRFGFTQADISGGGSDRLIDAIIPHGSPDDVAEAARAHLEAGADHVCLQPLGGDGIPREAWSALAGALAGS